MQLEFTDERRGGSVYLIAKFLLDVTVLSSSPKQNLLGKALLPFYRTSMLTFHANKVMSKTTVTSNTLTLAV